MYGIKNCKRWEWVRSVHEDVCFHAATVYARAKQGLTRMDHDPFLQKRDKPREEGARFRLVGK